MYVYIPIVRMRLKSVDAVEDKPNHAYWKKSKHYVQIGLGCRSPNANHTQTSVGRSR